MKTNDLRIGNLVLNDDGGVCKLFNIHEGYINHKPIPLTEEWLLKFGFEPLPFVNLLNSYTKSIGRNRILSIGSVGTPNEMIWLCEVNSVDKKIIEDLVCIRNYDYDKYTHVHQLQNLYFALTGEELEVKQ